MLQLLLVSSRGDGAQAFAAVLWQCFGACTKLEKLSRRVYRHVDAALEAGDETKCISSKAPPGAWGAWSDREECFKKTLRKTRVKPAVLRGSTHISLCACYARPL